MLWLRHAIIFAFVLPVLLFSFVMGPEAAIYRYVDAEGRIHFTNVPTSTSFRFYMDESGSESIANLIDHYAKQFRLDAALIKAVIKVESDFKTDTISSKGAQGLMQLMPETAREIGVKNPFDPTQGIYGGSFYLRKMLDYFDSNLEHALAAYNAGPKAVKQYGGVPPYRETQDYVKRVKYYLDFYRLNKDQLR